MVSGSAKPVAVPTTAPSSVSARNCAEPAIRCCHRPPANALSRSRVEAKASGASVRACSRIAREARQSSASARRTR